jgi:Flp pilus assembly pilin Flp
LRGKRAEIVTIGTNRWRTLKSVGTLGFPRAVLSETAGEQGAAPAMNLQILRAWVHARLSLSNERGANLVEYLLLLAFIAIVVLVAVKTLGGTISSKFSSANGALG